MLIIIPVSRFDVSFETVEGAPYSRYDQLIARAIDNGVVTIDELSRYFAVHRRLVVSSIVALIHTGWLAINSDSKHTFSLTHIGKKAIDNSEIPMATIIKKDDTTMYVCNVTGGIFTQQEAKVTTTKELKKMRWWEDSIKIRPSSYSSKPDLAQMHVMLQQKHSKKRIRSVVDAVLRSQSDWYLPVGIDRHTKSHTNIPLSLEELLNPVIEEKIEENGEPQLDFMGDISFLENLSRGDRKQSSGIPVQARAPWNIETLIRFESTEEFDKLRSISSKSMIMSINNIDDATCKGTLDQILTWLKTCGDIYVLIGTNCCDEFTKYIEKIVFDTKNNDEGRLYTHKTNKKIENIFICELEDTKYLVVYANVLNILNEKNSYRYIPPAFSSSILVANVCRRLFSRHRMKTQTEELEYFSFWEQIAAEQEVLSLMLDMDDEVNKDSWASTVSIGDALKSVSSIIENGCNRFFFGCANRSHFDWFETLSPKTENSVIQLHARISGKVSLSSGAANWEYEDSLLICDELVTVIPGNSFLDASEKRDMMTIIANLVEKDIADVSSRFFNR